MYQNDARGDIIKDFVRKYEAHGVVDVVDCHTYATLTNRIKEASREAGANYMSLETDYSKQDVGQIRTRLEAFMELL
nr:2-hydroxyacyl-CoA dehydratase family protein [uncultured Campylobacter sp.]